MVAKTGLYSFKSPTPRCEVRSCCPVKCNKSWLHGGSTHLDASFVLLADFIPNLRANEDRLTGPGHSEVLEPHRQRGEAVALAQGSPALGACWFHWPWAHSAGAGQSKQQHVHGGAERSVANVRRRPGARRPRRRRRPSCPVRTPPSRCRPCPRPRRCRWRAG